MKHRKKKEKRKKKKKGEKKKKPVHTHPLYKSPTMEKRMTNRATTASWYPVPMTEEKTMTLGGARNTSP